MPWPLCKCRSIAVVSIHGQLGCFKLSLVPARKDMRYKTRDFLWLILRNGCYLSLILSLITLFLLCLSIQKEPWNEFMFYVHFSVNHEKGTFPFALSSSCYLGTIFLIKFWSITREEVKLYLSYACPWKPQYKCTWQVRWWGGEESLVSIAAGAAVTGSRQG